MLPELRGYQTQLDGEVSTAYANGAQVVCMQLATGGGKTVILAKRHLEHAGASAIISHRQEITGQISMALARNGVRHNLIASHKTREDIAKDHVETLGTCFYDPSSMHTVCSVDTLTRAEGIERWAAQVTFWTSDEGHHVVRGNKWDTAIKRFPATARGLLPTATPGRADGKGLGRHAQGLADVLIQGPPMRWLIDQGFLCDYEVVAPSSDMEMIVEAGASGDWNSKQLREAAKRSHIVGDVVKGYLTWGAGRLGISFMGDVDTAIETARAYNAAGVRAEAITGSMDSGLRRSILRQYAARQIMQIVAVDVVSEGFDLPAMEVASFGRPTQSLPLFMQQCGRPMRPSPGKNRCMFIDHVGNFVRHKGGPDMPRVWSLDARTRRQTESSVTIKVCPACLHAYQGYRVECPYCGHVREPVGRSSPQIVEGDMVLLDPRALAALRGTIELMDMQPGDFGRAMAARGMPAVGLKRAMGRHRDDMEAQTTLRHRMALWCGRWHVEGLSDREIQRLFYITFAIDILTAQTIRAADSAILQERIEQCL